MGVVVTAKRTSGLGSSLIPEHSVTEWQQKPHAWEVLVRGYCVHDGSLFGRGGLKRLPTGAFRTQVHRVDLTARVIVGRLRQTHLSVGFLPLPLQCSCQVLYLILW
jgi:hypothetical protein